MDIEQTVKDVLNRVLDVEASEIKPEEKLDESLGVDSTEMVEISVGIKKELGFEVGDNELKKTHSYNEIVEILKSK